MVKRLAAGWLCLILLLSGCAQAGETPAPDTAPSSTETASAAPDATPSPTETSLFVPDTIVPDTTVPDTTVPPASTAAASSPDTAAQTTEAEPADQTVTFRFAGDFTQAEYWTETGKAWVMETFDERDGGDITKVFDEELLGLMRDADVFMLNNEFVYTDSSTPRAGKRWTYKASPERVKNLDILGVDIVGLANNHAFDWEEESLLDTLDTLKAAGMPCVGAGRDLEEASRVHYFEIEGRTFGIVAATAIEHYGGSNYNQTQHAAQDQPGVFYVTSSKQSLLDPCLQAIREAKANADYCFMYVHWGIEKTTDIEEEQTKLAHAFIDAGADAVIGSHPHVLQGFDWYRGKPILYSLGNYWFNTKDLDSCLLEFIFHTQDMENVQVRFIPCRQHDCRTTSYTDPDDHEKALKRMQNISFGTDIDENGVVTERVRE